MFQSLIYRFVVIRRTRDGILSGGHNDGSRLGHPRARAASPRSTHTRRCSPSTLRRSDGRPADLPPLFNQRSAQHVLPGRQQQRRKGRSGTRAPRSAPRTEDSLDLP